MRASDFFVEEDDPDAAVFLFDEPFITSEPTNTRFDLEKVDALRKGPLDDVAEPSAALGLLDLVHEELEAYGTDGSQRLDDAEIEAALRALKAATQRLGQPVELPFRNFTQFRSYWIRRGASGAGGWQARRDILDELLDPTRTWLQHLDDAPPGPVVQDQVIANLRDPAAIREQLDRIARAVLHDDPALVIGSAKELVESTAKAVLIECGQPVSDKDDLPALVSQSQRALGLHPGASQGPDGTEAVVKRILGGMSTITTGLAELRNRYGTGHGTAGTRIGLHRRHAQLAANAAITWCQLVLDTLSDPDAPWKQTTP